MVEILNLDALLSELGFSLVACVTFKAKRKSPAHVGELAHGTEIWLRISVTVEAPSHAERLRLIDDLHLVDSAMTGDAPDTTIHVGLVTEVGIVGDVMDLGPFDRKTILVTCLHRLELGALGLDQGVAIHAGLRGWNRGMIGTFDGVVTVPTVHSKLPRMQGMTEGDRLDRLVADFERLRAEPVRHEIQDIDWDGRTNYRKKREKSV